jgi:hypothetical protein
MCEIAFHIACGDLATWVGALATIGVGIVAAIIARQQYLQQQFRPVVYAYYDTENRIVVQIVNERGGAGQVREITVREDARPKIDLEAKWQVAGEPDPVAPRTPFALPGSQTAQVVFRLGEEVRVEAMHIVVEYGNGKSTGRLPTQKLSGPFDGTTQIP